MITDIRYALRMLAKNPAFAGVVVLTLALGIGANAAIFSLLDQVLIQSLPVANPDQLVVLSAYYPKDGPGIDGSFSYAMYQDLRDRNSAFSGVIARGGTQMNVTYGDRTERVLGELVSGNFFEVLGVRPWAGRFFTQDDDRTPSAHPVAVLSYSFWERRFNKDPNIIDKTILVNETPLTVLGVAPPGFYGLDLSNNPDVRVPLMMTPVFNPLPPTRLTSRRHQWLSVMARIKSDITPEQAEASLAVTYQQIRQMEADQLSASISEFNRERYLTGRIAALPGDQGLRHMQKELKTSLLLLFGATCAVLLILCANLANLMLARATVRAQETAVRLALGAGRLRLLRQWLTEGVVLAAIGGAVGVFIALWIKAGLIAFIPADFKQNLSASVDWRLYAFILVVSLVIGLAFSLAPAIRAARQVFSPGLQLESRSFTSAGRLLSLRSGLILVQVALSLPLLVSAALLLKTLQNLRSLDTGFGKDNVLLASVNPALNGYQKERSIAFYDDLLAKTRALPGVKFASLATDSPISGGWDQIGVVVEGYTPKQGERMSCDATWISSDYFKALEIPFVTGRDFDDHDRVGAPKVVIVNERMAKHYFGTTDVLGKHIGFEDVADTTIVGVVKDAQYVNLRESRRRHFYLPTTQEKQLTGLTLHVKTTTPPDLVAEELRAQLKAIDPHLPLYNIKTLSTEIDESLVQERLVTWLTAAFGVLATLLTALGLYGVLTFSVARRTREIGIRVALGAQRRDVFRLIMIKGVILVGVGVAIGLAASFGLSRLMSSLLFGVAPNNIATLVGVSAGLIVVALLACYIPARRATKVDPMVALRYE
ncbi:MAG TPA: ABC transporter permease [Pyrinomonadaceae bacterium]|jgi:predicted permease|nr:ABC transporter permease [Pyrinomonadaceae bacterium]